MGARLTEHLPAELLVAAAWMRITCLFVPQVSTKFRLVDRSMVA